MEFSVVQLRDKWVVIRYDMTLGSEALPRRNHAAQPDLYSVDSYWDTEQDATSRANYIWAHREER